MRKVFLLMMCISLLMTGCGSESEKKSELPEKTISKTTNETTESIQSNEENILKKDEFIRMVMLEDKLYVDTGELGISPTCGTMDFSFDETTDQTPTKNGQTNFGKGYSGQYYGDNTIIIMIDDKPCVFGHNVNDVDNVGMSVTKATNNKAEICISNKSDKAWNYGEQFGLEYYDKETGIWKKVYPILDDYGFNDMACIVEPNKENNFTVDWEWLYGKLEPGKYRIIKDMSEEKEAKSDEDTKHTFYAEFEIE